MANPLVVPCPEGVWTKIATNVVTGNIRTLRTTPNVYFQTYRDTGTAAPVDRSDAVVLREEEPIKNSVSIDVYVWAEGADGSVRVEL